MIDIITDHLMDRPRKLGYLRKQINSVFDIWNTRYFYLDGTNLMYFFDEESDKPRNVINLKGCIIDGIWPNDSMFTFTIRDPNSDEYFYYLGAMTEQDAEDWMENLKKASILFELEELKKSIELELEGNETEFADFNPDMIEEIPETQDRPLEKMSINPLNNIDLTRVDVQVKDPNELTHCHLEQTTQEFKKILKDKERVWELVRHENVMKIYKSELEAGTGYLFKASFILDANFTDLLAILTNEVNSMQFNFFLKNINVISKFDLHTEVYSSEFAIDYGEREFGIRDIYMRECWVENKIFYCIRKSLSSAQRKKIASRASFGKRGLYDFDINFLMNCMKVEPFSEASNDILKFQVSFVIQIPKYNFIKRPIVEKFLIGYLVNHTAIKWNYYDLISALILSREKTEEIQNDSPKKEVSREGNHRFIGDRTKVDDNPENSQSRMFNKDAFTEKTNPIENFARESVIDQKPEEYENKQLSLLGVKRIADLPSSTSQKIDKLANLKKKQLETFQSLRKKLANITYSKLDDDFILRYLQFTKFNESKSERMIRATVKWRLENRVDEINFIDTQFDRHLFDIIRYTGRDKKNRPVGWWKNGLIQPKTMDIEGYKAYYVTFFEDMFSRLPADYEGATAIFDFKGFSVLNLNWNLVKWEAALEEHYPLRLETVYIVNTSNYLKKLWNMAKYFIAEDTRNKVIFLGDVKQEIFEVLKESMSPEIIPEEFGGLLKM